MLKFIRGTYIHYIGCFRDDFFVGNNLLYYNFFYYLLYYDYSNVFIKRREVVINMICFLFVVGFVIYLLQRKREKACKDHQTLVLLPWELIVLRRLSLRKEETYALDY